MILDVGCGYLSDHKRRKGIGVDLQKGTCDIAADVEYLPFTEGTFSFVYARNVLEHLENPLKALCELRRVMTASGKISITIPIHHNPCVDELLKLLFGFPLRIARTLKRLNRWRLNRRKQGFWHKNRIMPQHISKCFMVLRLEPLFPRHPFRCYYPFPDSYYIYGIKDD